MTGRFFMTIFILIFASCAYGQKFQLGVWCLTGQTGYDQIIQTSPDGSGNWVLKDAEKSMLEDLDVNYMIACTGGGQTCVKRIEQALQNYGIERDGEFSSTLEISPSNTISSQPYQVWRAIDTGGGPGDPAWRAYVDSGYASMNAAHPNKTGIHSFLAGAEVQLENPDRYSWLNYICHSLHTHAPGVPALVQDGYDYREYLADMFSQVDSMDIFNYHYYVFKNDTDSSGQSLQEALQKFVHALSYVQTELQKHYADAQLHFITQVQQSRKGNYRFTRKEEILCQNNLALAFGAKGIVYYLYGSLRTGNVTGLLDLQRNPTAQYVKVRSIHKNYQNTGRTFYDIGSEFMDLTWKTGYAIHQNKHEPIDEMYALYDINTRTPAGELDDEGETFIQVGILQNDREENHYMIVNRRCLNGARSVSVTFKGRPDHSYLVTDIFTGRETGFVPAEEDTFSYSFLLNEGEAKLLKLQGFGEN